MNHDVCLRVDSAFPERFLEAALAQGAVFARVRRSGERSLRIETDAHSADLLLSLCRRYGLNCRMLHRGGCTALRDLARRRWTLLPALALCILICALFLNHIWLVDVRFTESAQDAADSELRSRVYDCLEANGVTAGVSIRQIQTNRLKRQILASVEELSYVGVRRQGVRLQIELAPETPAPQVYALEDARDLLASRNGVIQSVTVYSGEACVQSGDTVLRGDTLIRGAEEKSAEETTPVGALGTVIARCWYEGTAQAELYVSEAAYTGRCSSGNRLRLGAFSLNLLAPDRYASEEIETEILPVIGLFLPLELEKTTHRETAVRRRSADLEELERQLSLFARADALRRIQAENSTYEIAASWLDRQISKDTLQIRAVYEIYTDIAVTRDALIEEVY